MDHTQLDRIFKRYRKSGGADDLAALFDLAADDLFALGVRLLRDASAAEDVLQETFLDLARGNEDHDGARAAWPYLAGMMRNRALAHRRREGRVIDEDRLATCDESELTPEHAAEKSELSAWLRSAVAELPEASRRLVDLVLLDGLRPGEIAHRTGTSPGAVRTALHRVIARLRAKAPAGATMPLSLVALEGRGLPAVRAAIAEKAASTPVAAGSGGTASTSKLGGIFGTKLAVGGLALVLVVGGGKLWLSSQEKATDELDTNTLTVGLADEDSRSDANRREREEATNSAASDMESDATERTVAASSEVEAAKGGARAEKGELTEGEFQLERGQGWSFARGEVVPEEEADFIYERRGQVRAPKGMKSDFLSGPQDYEKLSPSGLMAAITKLGFSATLAGEKSPVRLRDGEPEACVMALPLESGGWVTVALLSERGRTARFEYRSTRDENGVFGETSKPVRAGWVTLDGDALRDQDALFEKVHRAHQGRVERFQARVAVLDERVAESRTVVREDEGLQVAGVFCRAHASRSIDENGSLHHRWYDAPGPSVDYGLSTFSFEHGLRDDPEHKTRNDWSFCYSNGDIDVQTVVDDRSRIWRIRPGLAVESLTAADLGTGKERLEAKQGDRFLVHTLDDETDQLTFMEVLEVRPRESMIFAWRNLEGDGRFDSLLLAGRTMMESPRVVARMRMGHDGGNSSEVYLDRTKDGYYDEFTKVTSGRIRELPIGDHDDTEVDIEGGGALLPGQTWVVTRVVWEGAIERSGSFRVVVAGQDLVAKEGKMPWSRGDWEGRIEVKDADLRRCFVRAAYFSAVEVIFEGHFE